MVSVIMPCYNCENHIEKAINSVLEQNYKDIEIIAINDGSTDRTLDILKSFEDKITIINVDNGGVSSARNHGLRAFKGDYVVFLDSDDYLDKDAIETLYNLAKEKDADIIRYGKIFEFENKPPKIEPFFSPSDVLIHKHEFKKYIYHHFLTGIKFNMVTQHMFKARVIKDIYFRQDMKTAEDAVFCIEAFTKAKTFYSCSKSLFHYQVTGTGLTGSGLKILSKYKYNIMLSKTLINFLPKWDMDNLWNRFLAYFRLVIITISKIKRGL